MMIFNFYDCENCLTVFAVATDVKEVQCPNPQCSGMHPSPLGHADVEVPSNGVTLDTEQQGV